MGEIKLLKGMFRFLLTAYLVATASLAATVLYQNDFETDLAGWQAFGVPLDAVRVNGPPSASGVFHASSQTTGAPGSAASVAGNWGGYHLSVGGTPGPFQPYETELKIYLDLSAGLATDSRFDFSSAISQQVNSFLRDFVFNVGFYNAADSTSPGSGQDRFIVSASNNAGRSNSNPFNPGRSPIAITTEGYYTFRHRFYDNAGVLAVDLTIETSTGTTVGSWTLSDPTDLTATVVGGNRYGWLLNVELPIAFDDAVLRSNVIVEPGPTYSPGPFSCQGQPLILLRHVQEAAQASCSA